MFLAEGGVDPQGLMRHNTPGTTDKVYEAHSLMIALLKAVPFGVALTLIVCLFMGSGGASGGTLAIRSFDVVINDIGLDMTLYWSWYLFIGGTGLTWVLLLMMGD